MNEIRIETGSGSVTMRMLRKCQRKMMCASVTRMISSVSACLQRVDGAVDQLAAVVERPDA